MTRLTLKIFLWLFACLLFCISAGLGLMYYYEDELPPLSELQHYDMSAGSEVYDINDNLIHTFAFEKRNLIKVKELPPYVISALLATEDVRFFDHWGLDQTGFLRAFASNIKNLSFSQGASTITQQLARNMFLTTDKKIARKIKELVLAIRIEQHYSKEEILEMYFNKVLFGIGIYGIQAASQRYFGKDAKDLTLPEGALIVGITQLPGAYYPIRHPERSVKRRNIVLSRMLAEEVITKEEYEEAVQTPLVLYKDKTNYKAADYFTEHVRIILEKKYGTKQLFAGGMKIYTTIDMDLQQYADSVLNRHLTKFEEKNNYEVQYSHFPQDTSDFKTEYVQGAVFAVDPETGYVPLMIGGRNFNHSKWNRIIRAKRQPGSSFKPLIYSSALESGYTPATVIEDQPLIYVESDTVYWQPNNYSYKFSGYTRMREALKYSRNIYAIKMLTDIGPVKAVRMAKRFGLSTKIYPVFSLAAGTCEVYPWELISSYTAFAGGGERVNPVYIRRVEDANGNILEVAEIEKIKVLEPKTAYLMANLMKSVIEEGTGAGVKWRGYKWPGAGKTGTTDDFNDAWFIGYNRKMVLGVWVGFDENKTLGKGQSGAVAALPVWPKIMKYAMEKDAPKNRLGRAVINSDDLDFEMPAGIITEKISKETGLLPKSVLDETLTEYFIAGTEPTPLMDTLRYNFIPTIYKPMDGDTLYFDMGGTLPENLAADSAWADSFMVNLEDKTVISVDSLRKHWNGIK
ncbi:MAG: penicillin-binding protein 1A [Candidatus Cloacimonadota bacterium]|nr:MAG: penicillin-binding protein 1A [Candidatus Cloacimonadota bacterium]